MLKKKIAKYNCENIIRHETSTIMDSNKNASSQSKVSRLELPSFTDTTRGHLFGTASRSYLSSFSRTILIRATAR